jgi:hypothetical protein
MVVNYEDWFRISILGLDLLPKVNDEYFEIFHVGTDAYIEVRVPVSQARSYCTINGPSLSSCLWRGNNEFLVPKHESVTKGSYLLEIPSFALDLFTIEGSLVHIQDLPVIRNMVA